MGNSFVFPEGLEFHCSLERKKPLRFFCFVRGPEFAIHEPSSRVAGPPPPPAGAFWHCEVVGGEWGCE